MASNVKEIGEELQTVSSTLKDAKKGFDEVTKSISGTISELKNIYENVLLIGTGFTDLQTFFSNFAIPMMEIVGSLSSVMGEFGKVLSNYPELTSKLSAGFTSLTGSLTGALAPILAIIAVIALVALAISDLWENNEEFRTAITEAWNSISETFTTLWDTTLKPIFDSIASVFTNIYENGILPLWETWTSFIGDIAIEMAKLWESIKPFVDWLIETFGPILSEVFDVFANAFGANFNGILNTFGSVIEGIKGIVSGVITVFQGIINFISGIFTGNWKKAWNGVKEIFSGIIGTLENIFKTPIRAVIGIINSAISGLNKLIKGINKIKFDIPDWVPLIGGKEFGFNIPKIPKIPELAKGGDLMNGIAMVGEAGPELLLQNGTRTTVAPLTRGGGADPVDIIDYNKMAQIFMHSVMGMMDGVSVKMDRREFGKLVSEVNK
ncbi:hypothetical protein LJC02_00795 [Breznakia sp. OttesenSCG-928-G09]|nr:hypothetical protein [Breznakia sp. OttesenSCG-928-G09]